MHPGGAAAALRARAALRSRARCARPDRRTASTGATSPASPHSTSMCEPGVQRGSGRPSGATRRSRTMPSRHRVDALDRHARARAATARRCAPAARAFAAPRIAALRVRRRIPLDPQVLGPAERGVGHVGEGLLAPAACAAGGAPAPPGRSASPCARGSCPCTGARRSRRSGGRWRCRGGCRRGRHRRSGARRGSPRHDDQQLRALGQVDAADARVLRRDAPPRRHRAVEAQAFLDRVRNQARVGAELLPHVGDAAAAA